MAYFACLHVGGAGRSTAPKLASGSNHHPSSSQRRREIKFSAYSSKGQFEESSQPVFIRRRAPRVRIGRSAVDGDLQIVTATGTSVRLRAR